jgi:hypothetical protein
MVLQMRSYMRAISAEAVDQNFILKDPVRLPQTFARWTERHVECSSAQ